MISVVGQSRRNPIAALAVAIVVAFAFVGAMSDAWAADSVTLNGVRVGIHSDSTRVVIDLSESARFQATLASDGKSVVVGLPPSRWPAQKTTRRTGGLIADLSFDATDSASALLLVAKQTVAIKRAFPLAPDGRYGHRIVIDLVPSAAAPPRAVPPTAAPAAAAPPTAGPKDETLEIERLITEAAGKPSNSALVRRAPSNAVPPQSPSKKMIFQTNGRSRRALGIRGFTWGAATAPLGLKPT
jgi:hypothetical protein